MTLRDALKNSKGKIYYGMHFYPGVAEYQEEQGAFRVFLNEETIRKMGPSFAGRPVFVEHVDGVEESVDELRKDADGWVIESFFNAADGKHWVKFIVVTERAERAIQNGMRLSNAYFPTGSYGPGGQWNGVDYQKQILNGEYEHLAIVRHPRYEESVIMTPEQFKEYNDNLKVELERLANSKDERNGKMKILGWKKTKVENALDSELVIVLEKSKREVSVGDLIKEADDRAVKNEGNEGLADMSHKVKLHDGSYCNVGDLLAKHKAMSDEMEKMKQEGDTDELDGEGGNGSEDVENEEIDAGGIEEETDSESVPEMQNEEEEEDEEAKKKKEMADKKKNALEKKRLAKEKADKLRNAPDRVANGVDEGQVVEFSTDMVARGKSRYGSGA